MKKPVQIIFAVFVICMFIYPATADYKIDKDNKQVHELTKQIIAEKIPACIKVPVISVNAPESVSGTFDAMIDITDVSNLDIGVFDLSFDSNVLRVVDVLPGHIDGTDIPIDMWRLMDDDRVRIIFNLPGITGINGSGSLTIVNFEVTGSVGNTSVLALSNGSLVDTSSNYIAANWTDDEITIVAPVEVTVNAPESVSGIFNATIDITNVTDLDSGQFDLSFDSSVINVTGVDSGSIDTTVVPVQEWTFIDNDTIKVLFNLPGITGVSGSGSLATIHFTVTGAIGDNSILDISNGLLVDNKAIPIFALWVDDIITDEESTTEVAVAVNAPDSVSDTFDVTIDITDVTDLDSGQFDLSFNANVVNLTGVDPGSIDDTEIRLVGWIFDGSDTIRVYFNLPGISGVSGSGSLATIHFTVTGTAGDISILDISDGLLVDTKANKIPTLWSDDEVSV